MSSGTQLPRPEPTARQRGARVSEDAPDLGQADAVVDDPRVERLDDDVPRTGALDARGVERDTLHEQDVAIADVDAIAMRPSPMTARVFAVASTGVCGSRRPLCIA
jgi:hypothetical protein